jgi:hypothetical protein
LHELKLAELFDPKSNWAERLVDGCCDGLRSQKSSWMFEEKPADPFSPFASDEPNGDDLFVDSNE